MLKHTSLVKISSHFDKSTHSSICGLLICTNISKFIELFSCEYGLRFLFMPLQDTEVAAAAAAAAGRK